MYSSFKDPLYGYFANCLYEIRQEAIKARHVQLTHEELVTELGTRWRDIQLQDLLVDGWAVVAGEDVQLTPKAEQELLLSGIVPPKPKRDVVAEQFATIEALSKIMKSP